MRVAKVALAAAALATMLIIGSVASAASKPAGGRIQVFVSQQKGARANILITGAIGDYGKTISVDKNGKVDENGDFQKVNLKKGTFEVDATALDKKLSRSGPKVNSATCSLLFSGTARTTVFKGTGLYKGIRGSVKITVAFAAIAPRFGSGPHKGQCNFAQNVRPLSQYQSITGVGNVSF
jgi:hypothetical protein